MKPMHKWSPLKRDRLYSKSTCFNAKSKKHLQRNNQSMFNCICGHGDQLTHEINHHCPVKVSD